MWAVVIGCCVGATLYLTVAKTIILACPYAKHFQHEIEKLVVCHLTCAHLSTMQLVLLLDLCIMVGLVPSVIPLISEICACETAKGHHFEYDVQ